MKKPAIIIAILVALLGIGYIVVRNTIESAITSPDTKGMIESIARGVFHHSRESVSARVNQLNLIGFAGMGIDRISIKTKSSSILEITDFRLFPDISSALFGGEINADFEFRIGAKGTGQGTLIAPLDPFVERLEIRPVKMTLTIASLEAKTMNRMVFTFLDSSPLGKFFTKLTGTTELKIDYQDVNPLDTKAGVARIAFKRKKVRLQNLHKRIPPLRFGDVSGSFTLDDRSFRIDRTLSLHSKLAKLNFTGSIGPEDASDDRFDQLNLQLEAKGGPKILIAIGKLMGCKFRNESLRNRRAQIYRIQGYLKDAKCKS